MIQDAISNIRKKQPYEFKPSGSSTTIEKVKPKLEQANKETTKPKEKTTAKRVAPPAFKVKVYNSTQEYNKEATKPYVGSQNDFY